MRARSILLFSKEVERLAAFLSALFEVESEWDGLDVHLDFWGVPVVIKELAGKKYAARGETILELEVDDYQELVQLVDKSKFVEYRLELKSLNKKNKVEEDDLEHFLELLDPDGRRWRICCPKV